MSTICQSVLYTACIQIRKLSFQLKTRISEGGIFEKNVLIKPENSEQTEKSILQL